MQDNHRLNSEQKQRLERREELKEKRKRALQEYQANEQEIIENQENTEDLEELDLKNQEMTDPVETVTESNQSIDLMTDSDEKTVVASESLSVNKEFVHKHFSNQRIYIYILILFLFILGLGLLVLMGIKQNVEPALRNRFLAQISADSYASIDLSVNDEVILHVAEGDSVSENDPVVDILSDGTSLKIQDLKMQQKILDQEIRKLSQHETNIRNDIYKLQQQYQSTFYIAQQNILRDRINQQQEAVILAEQKILDLKAQQDALHTLQEDLEKESKKTIKAPISGSVQLDQSQNKINILGDIQYLEVSMPISQYQYHWKEGSKVKIMQDISEYDATIDKITVSSNNNYCIVIKAPEGIKHDKTIWVKF